MGTAAGAVLFCPVYLLAANSALGVRQCTLARQVLRPLALPLCIAVPGGLLLAVFARRPSPLSLAFVALLCVTWVASTLSEAVTASERERLWGLAGRARAALSFRLS